MESSVKIFSGRHSVGLAQKIAKSYGASLGNVVFNNFSDGEFQPSYEETVRGQKVFIIQSTPPPFDNLLELLLMIDAAKRASAKEIIAVVPYFGMARQDRKDKPRVPIGAKLYANLISSAGATRIMTIDLHADQIQGFLKFLLIIYLDLRFYQIYRVFKIKKFNYCLSRCRRGQKEPMHMQGILIVI